jgi:hypothetical protein
MWLDLYSAVPYIWCRNPGEVTGRYGPGLLPWLSCPALSRTQTAELTPRASRLRVSDLTALPAFPSIVSLSLPLLST